MTSAAIAKRLDALEATSTTTLQRLVIGEGGCSLYMLDQLPDETEDAFRDRVRGLWLRDGCAPSTLPVFDWGIGEPTR